MFSLSLYRHAAASLPRSPSRTVWRGNDCRVSRVAGGDGYARECWRGTRFCAREIAGVVAGAVREHWRALGGEHVWRLFSNRRFTMRTEFRFPKATAVLMMIILGGSGAGHPEGRSRFRRRCGALCESSHRTDPSGALRFVGWHRAGTRVLLCRGNDRVGDSIRNAPLGRTPTGRNFCQVNLGAPYYWKNGLALVCCRT